MSSKLENNPENKLEENASEKGSEELGVVPGLVGAEVRPQVISSTSRTVQERAGNNLGNEQGRTSPRNQGEVGARLPAPPDTPRVSKGLVKAGEDWTEQELRTLDRVSV